MKTCPGTDEAGTDAAPWKCFEQQLRIGNEAAMRRIPEIHIACSSTQPRRNIEALRAAADGRLWEIDTGHDSMITEPEAVTEMLLRPA